MTTRIMVIDDEPLICTLLEYQLGGAGYAVTTFQRGEEAMLRLAHEQPDLILLDVMMPEISGWDLCRQIRASSTVPIIMLTAKQGDEDVVTGLTSGADDYVGKPFHQAQLIARIEAVLRRAHGRAARPTPAPAPAQLPPAAVIPPPADRPAPAPAAPAPPAAPRPAPRPAPTRLPRLGPRLADARRTRGLSLHDAEQAAGVRWEFLQAIEQEQFSYVPRADLRHALKAYSALLEVDLAPYTGRRPRRSAGARSLSLTLGMVTFIAVALVVLAMAL
jgi:CheY-like chemotaxis protein